MTPPWEQQSLKGRRDRSLGPGGGRFWFGDRRWGVLRRRWGFAWFWRLGSAEEFHRRLDTGCRCDPRSDRGEARSHEGYVDPPRSLVWTAGTGALEHVGRVVQPRSLGDPVEHDVRVVAWQ